MSDGHNRISAQIPVQTLISNAQICAILEALGAGGKEVRFVGGCVRDAMLNREVSEYDLATPERPERITELLKNAGIKALPTGINHGTVTAVLDNTVCQITTLRRDVKTDGRHAIVEFTDNWKEDAARRDFTFNALSATPEGKVYDYFNGLQDLSNRVIKFVGRAEERIMEDHLRILRYFRFIAVLGMQANDRRTQDLCVKSAYLIANLSGERIRNELFKILKSENKCDALGLMITKGITDFFLPEAVKPILLKTLMWLETSATKFDSVGVDPIRRLASLIETNKAGVDAISDRLKFSNDQRQKLKDLVEPRWQATWNINENKLRALIYQFGPAYIVDLVLLKWSRMLNEKNPLTKEQTDAWLHIIETADGWTRPMFPVRGQDLLDLNVEKGPRISSLLNQVEDWWMDGGCHADRTACLDKLKQCLDNT